MDIAKVNLEVHLTSSHPVTRDNTRQAFALNEPDLPNRQQDSNTYQKVNSIHDIIEWLDVEDSERYRKRGSATYCNIYAYDYCYLCNTFIPRVWWDEYTCNKVMSGQTVNPIYGTNVFELNVNSIYDWFEKYGNGFGWDSTDNLTYLQDSANAGKVCIIIAKRKLLSRSGHITVVVPENDVFTAKKEDDKVVIPLESQAGSKNYEYITKGHCWWKKNKFSDFKFWIHE